MKVVYLVQNPGIESRTPEGWRHALASTDGSGRYPDQGLAELADADVLVVGLEPVDAGLLAHAPRVRLIQRLGRGYENVDLAAAGERGIAVCGMPDFNAGTVAEHTLMLVLALQRRVFDSTLLLKAGQWPLATVVRAGIHELAGRTLGLIGLGAIGRAVAARAGAFDAELLGFDQRDGRVSGVRVVELEELLERSDVVSLHLPLTEETRGLIGATELGRLRPHALLVNTARGALVDEDALAAALTEGRLAGAGLDVYADEPLPADHPLRRCPNVLLTPHTAGQTREAMERMVATMLDNLDRLARGDELRHRLA